MYRFVLLALLLPAAASAQAIDEYVVLVDGDTLRGEVTIHEPFLRSAYVSVDDSVEYRFDEVLEVKDGIDYYAIGQGGPFQKTMFAKRVRSGPISMYERVDEYQVVDANDPFGVNPLTPNSTTSARYEFFRKGAGPLQKASAGPLRDAMQDSPAALAVLKRRQTLGYVQLGMVGVGLGTLIAGALASTPDEGEEVSISPLVFVGGGLMVGSWIPRVMRQPLLQESIDTYNRDVQSQ